MNKAYNIIEAINMPVGTEFEVYLKGKEKPDSKLGEGNILVNCNYEFVWAKNNKCVYEIDRDIYNAKFYKVQNPVDFIEAIKAYSKGKKIRCSLNSKTDVYFKAKSYEGGFNLLVDDNGNGIDDTEILDGKWYIEDYE